MRKTRKENQEYMKLRRTTLKANAKFVKERDKKIKEDWNKRLKDEEEQCRIDQPI